MDINSIHNCEQIYYQNALQSLCITELSYLTCIPAPKGSTALLYMIPLVESRTFSRIGAPANPIRALESQSSSEILNIRCTIAVTASSGQNNALHIF